VTKSADLFQKAKKYIPGGVNSPVRSYGDFDFAPPFIKKGEGVWIYDVEGNKYLDYVLSWGPLIVGHAHPKVLQAVRETAAKGTSFGAPAELEIDLARMIVEMVPGIDKVRMVNSGTESVMSAVRLARGYTGKDKIIKMTGCYHGHSDGLLVEAGSGPAELSIPGSPGVPASYAGETISVPYNDRQAVKEAFTEFNNDIAAVLLEPVPANMGVILPRDGYLQFLRDITKDRDSLLIFDEVITGFRVARGGVQELYDIQPDLTCLGKIIGGGLPVGAFGGNSSVMSEIAPEGAVYQAGTLSGNPLAMAAGKATLNLLRKDEVYEELSSRTDYLTEQMKKIASVKDIPVQIHSLPGLFSLFFTEQKVYSRQEVKQVDRELFRKYFKKMLAEGIYLAPSVFESSFLSLYHEREQLDYTLEKYRKVLREI